MNSKEMWFVMLCAPWSSKCQNYEQEFKELAEKHKDKAYFGFVDVTLEDELKEMLKGHFYPVLKIWGMDQQKTIENVMTLYPESSGIFSKDVDARINELSYRRNPRIYEIADT